MHSEVQIAVNFVLSFLYNKLPRRRVNQFGEELENVLKSKFEDHWYPDTPFKGSAFRCLRFSRPLDPFVFDVAAQRAGLALVDVQEHLPTEMTIWIDPSEVSYRLGESEPVKTLFSRKSASLDDTDDENNNPANLSNITTNTVPSNAHHHHHRCVTPTNNNNQNLMGFGSQQQQQQQQQLNPNAAAFTPSVHNRPQISQMTYTAADFAATKFGSTKRRVNNIKKTKPIELNGGYGGRPGKFNKSAISTNPMATPEFKIPRPPGLFDAYDSWRGSNSHNAQETSNHHNNHLHHSGSLNMSQLQNLHSQQSQPQETSTSIWSMNETESNLFNSSFLDRYLPREHSFRASMAASDTTSLSLQNSNKSRWDIDLFSSPEVITKPSQEPFSSSSSTTSGSGIDLSGYFSSSSCTLSSLSSPSLASTDFSLHLINEFDNLSLNSTSSSSIGSMSSSYVN